MSSAKKAMMICPSKRDFSRFYGVLHKIEQEERQLHSERRSKKVTEMSVCFPLCLSESSNLKDELKPEKRVSHLHDTIMSFRIYSSTI